MSSQVMIGPVLICLLSFVAAIVGSAALILFRRSERRGSHHGIVAADPSREFGGVSHAPAPPVSPVALGGAQPAMIQPGTIQRAPARDAQFIYTTGDRPLDGYTIKRGIGRGGFGEVYYAVSDGGKEVALKLVQRHLDVELRGVTQCLNVKHANLVTIYDVKQAANGDTWVVMEYLSGAGLSDVLAANPNGLPHDQVIAWLRGICDGVGNLHEHGIVHRDLKPGNIFVENGIVKIGDYGLAKYISASRRSGQTESVGTVHYMAPEIAHGRYGKEIDLYAIGVILYELLTGRVPFEGQSPGEIMMKHLTAQPDTSVLPEPYRAVVAQLLAKDPADRFGTVHELLAQLTGESLPVAARIEAPARMLPQTAAFQQSVSWAPTPRRAWRSSSQETPRHSAWQLAMGIAFILLLTVAVIGMVPVLNRRIIGLGAIFLSVLVGAVIVLRGVSGRRRLYRAAKAGDISRVRLLLADGDDVNARRWSNRTALIAAAEAGHIAVVQHLLERGADPNARLSDGETALSLATVAGHAAVVEILLAAGADVNSRASDGDTPLIEAAYAGHAGILRKLLEHGADMTARSGGDGSTPLIWAAYAGHSACVEALLQHGANVNEKDTGDGSTPLIWAAYGNHPNVVRVLLDHGADPNETNSSGETAFDHAESDQIKQLLEGAMAKK